MFTGDLEGQFFRNILDNVVGGGMFLFIVAMIISVAIFVLACSRNVVFGIFVSITTFFKSLSNNNAKTKKSWKNN